MYRTIYGRLVSSMFLHVLGTNQYIKVKRDPYFRVGDQGIWVLASAGQTARIVKFLPLKEFPTLNCNK